MHHVNNLPYLQYKYLEYFIFAFKRIVHI